MKDDRRLESDSQRQAAEWVRDLVEDETPSLAWRSALNEGVRLEAERIARKRARWTVVRPTMGFAMAAAFAAVVFFPRPQPKTVAVGSRLEAGLIALHEDAVQTDDIVGTGLRPSESSNSMSVEPDPLIDLDAGAL